MTTICKTCGTPFPAVREDAKYCKPYCRLAAWRRASKHAPAITLKDAQMHPVKVKVIPPAPVDTRPSKSIWGDEYIIDESESQIP